MPKFKKLTIFKRFKVYKMLKSFSSRKLEKILKINRNTINKIRKEGFFKPDKLAYKIYLIKEREPHLTLKEIREVLIKKYNKKISIETIRKKLSKFGIYKNEFDEEIELFLNYLIEKSYYKEAKQILKFYKPRNVELLLKIPEKYIPLFLIPEKLNLEIEKKLKNFEDILNNLESYMKIAFNRKMFLTYYKLLALKVSILLYLNRYHEVYIIYINNINYILKLPLNVKLDILLRFLYISHFSPETSNRILKIIQRHIENPYIKNDIIKTYRNLGLINKAKKLSKGHFYDYFCEFDLKNFFKFSKYKFEDKENELLYKIFKLILVGVLKKQFYELYNLKKEIEKEYNEIGLKVYEYLYYFALAIYYISRGEIEKSNKFLNKSIKTAKIILNKDKIELSKFRKQELVLKYILKGNLKLAVDIARRYGLIAHLNIYTLLTKKHYSKVRRYKELIYISRIIRKQNKLKAYFMRFYPVIYVNKTKYIIYRFSKSWIMLAYLIMNNGKAKIEELFWVKDIKSSIYFINKKFKTTLLSIHNNEVILNAEIECDINKFIKFSKISKLRTLIYWKMEPFRTICYRYHWAEDIRDACKIIREELMGYSYNFND